MENSLERPTYYGVMPADVRYDPDISASAKILFVEITALCNMTGMCWATNKYFAKLYGVQPTRISVWVKQLEAKGFISTRVIDGGLRGIDITKDPYAKAEAPLLQKQKHNTNTNNKSFVELQKSLLALVNEITGRSFRTLPERGTKKTLDAFTLEEIKLALRALVADDWHSERVKEFKIDYLIRATTIDKFLAIGKDTLGSKQSVTIENQDEMVRRRMGGV